MANPNRIDDPIISAKSTAEALGISLATLWRMRKRGDIPAPLKISAQRVGWRRSTIEAFLSSRQAA